MTYAGLIAAAGDSSRMGFPKALLPLGNSTFVEHLISVFFKAQLDPVIVTLPIGIKIDSSAICMTNHFPHLGFMGSIKSALSILPKVDGLVVCPVDCPFVSSELIQTLIKQNYSISVPTYQSERGHPIALSSSIFHLLPDEGLEHFLQNYYDIDEILWHDKNILKNINYPYEL